jgi:membrane protein DedA with SNARE-associated domain
MYWWRFLAWNAFGGIVWALLVGLVSFYAGHAAADAISHYGAIGGVAIVAALVVGLIGFQFWKRRVLEA